MELPVLNDVELRVLGSMMENHELRPIGETQFTNPVYPNCSKDIRKVKNFTGNRTVIADNHNPYKISKWKTSGC